MAAKKSESAVMARTSNPALDGMVDVRPASGRVRLSVCTVAFFNGTRYRAGLGPFGGDPVVVEATPEQADALRADPVLEVFEQD
jgi:hypothetical protein